MGDLEGRKSGFSRPESALTGSNAAGSGRPGSGRARRVATVRRRRPTLSSQKGEDSGVHSLAHLFTLSLFLSPALRSRAEKGSSATVVVPSPAALATYTAPPLDSSRPHLCWVTHYLIDPLATPLEPSEALLCHCRGRHGRSAPPSHLAHAPLSLSLLFHGR